MSIKIWETRTVRLGEEAKLLEEGWEPFSVYAEDTSYHFKNTNNGLREIHPKSTPYISLRRIKYQ